MNMANSFGHFEIDQPVFDMFCVDNSSEFVCDAVAVGFVEMPSEHPYVPGKALFPLGIQPSLSLCLLLAQAHF